MSVVLKLMAWVQGDGGPLLLIPRNCLEYRGGAEARRAVIVRETGGCNRVWFMGARVHAVLAPILVTSRQRGVEALAYWQRVLTDAQRTPRLLPGQLAR